MINALVIEDEKPAAEHLLKMINSCGHEIRVEAIINSVSGAVRWFNKNRQPDLVFMDIQLSDGLSFEIFDYAKIECPVIFTTAYEEYAVKAFKVNSIDYLLKPVNKDDLLFAIKKFISHERQTNNSYGDLFGYQAGKVMQFLTKRYKTRFVVNAGAHIHSLETEEITCFYSLEKATYLLDNKGRSYDINYVLDQLEQLTDPDIFFRINRKYLINRNAITDIISFSGTKLKIKIRNISDDDIFVSRSRTKDFKQWLDM